MEHSGRKQYTNMAIDLDKVRAQLERVTKGNLSGDRGPSVQWKPKVGKHVVRTLPWPDMKDGEIYHERWWHYDILPRGGLLALEQFGKPDPVKDLRIKCFEDKSPEMREMGKKLFARPAAYAPIIVRGEEHLGVRLWRLNKTVHQELLGYYLDRTLNGAPNGIADIEAGFDIDVEITPVPNSTFFKTKTAVPRDREASPLSKDKALVKEWMSKLPNIDEMYPCPDEAEVKKALDAWLTSTSSSADGSTGTEIGRQSSGPSTVERANSDLDAVFDELSKED